jgi:hypothetical protein
LVSVKSEKEILDGKLTNLEGAGELLGGAQIGILAGYLSPKGNEYAACGLPLVRDFQNYHSGRRKG